MAIQLGVNGGIFGKGGDRKWLAASGLVAALVVAPVVSLAVIASQGSGDLWPHIFAFVLPQALKETAILLLGVGVVVVTLGTTLAWIMTAYDFPGRRAFDWALLLPLAMPTYIVAFAYLDLLHPIGPIQTALRALFGIQDVRGLWFPEVRSMGGCIVLLGFVLYPYVYLSTRAMFLMQAGSLLEASRTLGASRSRMFFRVALPLARPAIAVGASLALMEALNDIGASEFLGVRTLSVSIYSTWINRSNLPGAAQIALAMLAIVVSLILFERWARRRQRYVSMAQRTRRAAPIPLTGWRAFGVIAFLCLPILIGFILPALHIGNEAWKRIAFAGVSPEIWREIVNTISISAVATFVAISLGFLVASSARLSHAPVAGAFLRASSLGYAVPGTVLAIGLMTPIFTLDNMLADGLEKVFNISAGLLISGSGAALVYAYAVRFLAISAGGVESGLSKLSPSLDAAARALGETAGGAMRRVHLPLLRPALGAAALLVFVDCMKELPATLLLRPLNFETLATHLYGEAARGTYEDGSVAAMCIILVGLIPVIMLARLGRRRQFAHDSNGAAQEAIAREIIMGETAPAAERAAA
ncbi:MAG: ABC transporter permease [Beijerinckiaceae bacterium]